MQYLGCAGKWDCSLPALVFEKGDPSPAAAANIAVQLLLVSRTSYDTLWAGQPALGASLPSQVQCGPISIARDIPMFRSSPCQAFLRAGRANHIIVRPEKARAYFGPCSPGAKCPRGRNMNLEADWFGITPYAKYPSQYRCAEHALPCWARVLSGKHGARGCAAPALAPWEWVLRCTASTVRHGALQGTAHAKLPPVLRTGGVFNVLKVHRL